MDDREFDEQLEQVRQRCHDHCGRGWAWAFLMLIAFAVAVVRVIMLEIRLEEDTANRPVLKDERVVDIKWTRPMNDPNGPGSWMVMVEDGHGSKRALPVLDVIGNDWVLGYTTRVNRAFPKPLPPIPQAEDGK